MGRDELDAYPVQITPIGNHAPPYDPGGLLLDIAECNHVPGSECRPCQHAHSGITDIEDSALSPSFPGLCRSWYQGVFRKGYGFCSEFSLGPPFVIRQPFHERFIIPVSMHVISVQRPSPLKDLLDRALNHVQIERLGNEQGRILLNESHRRVVRIAPCHDDDLGGRRNFLDRFHDIHAVKVGKINIEKAEVVEMRTDFSERLSTVLNSLYFCLIAM
jgi:hypothetical protein